MTSTFKTQNHDTRITKNAIYYNHGCNCSDNRSDIKQQRKQKRRKMKKTILLAIVILFTLASCNDTNKTKSKDKTIYVYDLCKTNQLIVDLETNENTVFITKEQKDLIDSFSQPAKDAAYYVLANKERYKIDRFHFQCGKFKFWIANEYYGFEIDSPIEFDLNNKEKAFFYNIYRDFLYNENRIYNYENEINIVIK